MRLPRFRVRTLMIAVSVVALLVWVAMMGTQSYDYYRRARLYSIQERLWREHAQRDLGQGATRTIAARWGLQIADYYAPLARKYRRAMWRPWLPVAPDPHAPGFDQWKVQESRAKEVAPDPPPPELSPPQSQ
jgi:hypothetical protein